MLVLVSTLLIWSGCGPAGPELVTVTGVVTLDGKPVPKATISFLPSGEKGSPSYGRTDLQGKYELGYSLDKKGALIGNYNVEIAVARLSAAEKAELKASGEEVPDDSITLPQKYNKAGSLTAEVKSGANEINFALTSD